MKPLVAAFVMSAAAALPAAAEVELSFYLGYQTAPHSTVEGSDPGGVGDFDFNAGWEGKSFDMPPYWGVRATWWRGGDRLGYGVDFTHAKIYADGDTLTSNGFDTLEFTDGLNYLTGNIYYRWTEEGRRWTPYVGLGAGIAVPHVEVATAGGSTIGYQYVGPTVQLTAGISYELNDRWSLFGEYKGNFTSIDADLDNGGSLETDVITNALNMGIALEF